MADNAKVGSVLWEIKVKSDDAEKKLNSFSNSVKNLNGLMGLFKAGAFIRSLQSIGEVAGKWTKKQAEYIQVQGIFNKTMGESVEAASEFRDAMQMRLGIDAQEVMSSMNLFSRLTETFGLSSEASYKMSKNLTQLAADYTAYGYKFNEVVTKIRAGISGEIKGMRSLGVALDEATLQETLYSLGIDRRVDSLTRAQKTELLYYQIMTQTAKVQGELGRTILTPSSALRILKQEFTQLGRAIGSIFIPLAMKIIPVVRAVVQILTDAAKAIAKFFGFNIGDYTSNYSEGLIDISDGLEDIEDSAVGATKAMNKMLMPFDELNNINFSSGSGGGAGGIGAGGSLLGLEDLPEYNIFDSIVGNIDSQVEKIKDKLESMLPVFKTIGIALGAAFAVTKLVEFLEWANKVHTALSALGTLGGIVEMGLGALITIAGIWTQWKGTEKLLNGDYSIWAILETIGGTALGTFGIVTILKGIQSMGGLQTLTTGNMIGIGLGVMLLIQSFQVLMDGIKTGDVNKVILGLLEGGIGLGAITWKMGVGKILLPLTIDIALALGIVNFASNKENEDYIRAKMFDGKDKEDMNWVEKAALGINTIGKGVNDFIADFTGFNIANTVADIEDIGLAFDNDSKYLKNFREELKHLKTTYDETKQSILDNKQAKLDEIAISEDYLKYMDNIIDENGHVKEGYTDLAEYILGEYSSAFGGQYELIDGIIYKNGEAISSYAEFRDEIDKNIQKMKEEAEQAANLELYKQAYTQRKKYEQELKRLAVEKQEAELKYDQALQKGSKANQEELDKLSQKVYETGRAYTETLEESMQNYSDLNDYSIESFGTLTEALDESNEEQKQYLQNLFLTSQDTWEKVFDNATEDEQLAMVRMSTDISRYTPEMAKKWEEMANKNPEKFKKAYDEFKRITDETMVTTTKKIAGETRVSNAAATLARDASNKFGSNLNLGDFVSNGIQGMANAFWNGVNQIAPSLNNLVNHITWNISNVDYRQLGRDAVAGIADGFEEGTFGWRFKNAVQNIANRAISLLKSPQGFDEHSPSKRMRDEVGYYIPLGIADGIDKGAYAVEDSVQSLIERTRVDMEGFDIVASSDLVSNINGNISAKTSTALSENTLDNMMNATYQGVSKALNENTEDYNPQFNVYVGNDKVYSGFGNYQSNESNRYGVRV